jgi:hypothetical protein
MVMNGLLKFNIEIEPGYDNAGFSFCFNLKYP